MIKTIISLDSDIKQWVDIKAQRDGTSMTRLVAEALRRMKAQEEADFAQLLSKSSGIWTAGDGLAYQQELRDEWDGR